MKERKPNLKEKNAFKQIQKQLDQTNLVRIEGKLFFTIFVFCFFQNMVTQKYVESHCTFCVDNALVVQKMFVYIMCVSNQLKHITKYGHNFCEFT